MIAALGLMPMAYDQWVHEFPDVKSTLDYTSSHWSTPSPTEALRLIHAVIVFGPQYVNRFVLELTSAASGMLLSVYAVLLMVSAAGLFIASFGDPPVRRLILIMVGTLFLHSMFLASIRATMPPWMILTNWGLIAALITLGPCSILGKILLPQRHLCSTDDRAGLGDVRASQVDGRTEGFRCSTALSRQARFHGYSRL
jgi:hypothetical protein